MLRAIIASVFLVGLAVACAPVVEDDLTARNKQLASDFYQDLWFTNNTEKYSDYVADTYVIHDIGDAKGLTKPAITQKKSLILFTALEN